MSELRRVVLEKIAGAGGLPVGARFEYTYTTNPERVAVPRAWKALARDHPGERASDWQLVPN